MALPLEQGEHLMGFPRRFSRGPARSSPKPENSPAPEEVYLGLRGRLMAATPSDVGIAPTDSAPRVWSVLFEMGMKGGTATVVALADGTASLYTSTGGGVIGGGSHERVADAVQRCVRVADAALDAFPPAETVPLPPPGRSALVVLTFDGPRRVEFDDATPAGPAGPASTLYRAAHDVVTELRQVTPTA